MYAIAALVVCVAVIYIGRLMNLQIASHDYYSSLSNQTITKFETIETTRGEIYDSDGKPLVTNEIHYNLRLNRSYLPYGGENAVIIRLLQFFDKHGIAYTDGMPITLREPFTLTADTENNRALRVFVEKNSSAFDEDVDMFSDTNMYDYIFGRYKLDDYRGRYSEAQLRRVAGMRFDLEVADFGVSNPYTVLTDIDENVRLSIADILHDLPGVEISTTAERIYNGGSLAAHVLGFCHLLHRFFSGVRFTRRIRLSVRGRGQRLNSFWIYVFIHKQTSVRLYAICGESHEKSLC